MRLGAVAAATFAVTVGLARPATAGPLADAATIETGLRRQASVTRLRPRLFVGTPGAPIPLPPAALLPSPACVRVVVLGAASAVFGLRVPNGEGEDLFPSVAGMAEISRCGKDKAALAELVIELHSSHLVLEIILARSEAPLASARGLLPHRDPGMVEPARRPGPPPAPASLVERADAIERRFREARGENVERRLIATGPNGRGRVLVELSAGCHSVAALGAPPTGDVTGPHDVDAELSWTTGTIAAEDHTDNPDATLFVCAARRELAVLTVLGSVADAPVLVVHARRDLPKELPERWGPEARARLAKAFLTKAAPEPTAPPIFETFGEGDLVSVPLELVPGECYVAAAVPLQGTGKVITLGASTGLERALSHSTDAAGAALLTFCAGGTEHGSLDVEMRGTGVPLWLVGMWAVGHRRLGEDRP